MVPLVSQLLNSRAFYLALDGDHFYRRWGPRQLVCFPLAELGPFTERSGAVSVIHQPTRKKIPVIKNAYSPERLGILAQRLNTWRESPPSERATCMNQISLREAHEARTAGNRLIVRGLAMACLLPLLIVLSHRFNVFGPREFALRAIVWSMCTLAGLITAIRGVITRVAALSARQQTQFGLEPSAPEVEALSSNSRT